VYASVAISPGTIFGILSIAANLINFVVIGTGEGHWSRNIP
jgi:hypothetical protein